MVFVQLTGLPGAGKTTLSEIVKEKLLQQGRAVELLDGDALRKTINKDLGFSRADRQENLRRLGAMGHSLFLQKKIVIIAAVLPVPPVGGSDQPARTFDRQARLR